MPKIEASANGAILIDNKPHNVGNLELLVNGTFTAAAIYHIRFKKEIVEMHPIGEWTDDTDTPFASYQDFIDYLDPFFFRSKVSGGGGFNFTYLANDFTNLNTVAPQPIDAGTIAYVFNSEGTAWLPATMGGSYYPAGIYVSDGAEWVSDRNSIANQLQINIDDIDQLEADLLQEITDRTNADSALQLQITDNANDIIDNETDITNHVNDLANPHDTSIGNIDSGTLAELNAAITDATLDDSSDPRTPTAHATTHEEGGSDEIEAANLKTTYVATNYTPTDTDLDGQLTGIDNALASAGGEANTSSNSGTGEGLALPKVGVDLPFKSLVAGNNISLTSGVDELTIEAIASSGGITTAGIINRNYLTGDSSVLVSGTYYDILANDRGTVASQTQVINLNDNTKGYYAQDFIGSLTTSDQVLPQGTYTGQLTCQVSGNGGEQEWTIEVYLADADGNVISSGISGAPVGDLGVEVLTILQTGEVDLQAGNPSQLSLGGEVLEDINIPSNHRARYHISAEKIGAAGGAFDYTIFFGSDYESYVDVPAIRNTCFESMAVGSIDGTQASANTVYAIKTLVPYDMPIANIGTIISSAGGGTVYMGVYDDTANKDLIVEVSQASPSNGNLSINTGQVDKLTAGSYVWLAYKENLGSVTFFKHTTVTDDDICLSQFFGGAGLPADLSGAFASNVVPYITVCS